MAIAFVNHTSNGNLSDTSVLAAAAVHTAGNLLVVFVNTQLADAVTVSDTAGNSFFEVPNSPVLTPNAVNRLRLFYAWNCLGHATNVVRADWAGTSFYNAIAVNQFSGVMTTDPIGDSDEGSGAGTALATPSLTVAASEEVIVAGMEADAQGLTAGSGYTLTLVNDGLGGYTASEYKIVTASEAATATCAGSGWGIIAACFKVATGGGTAVKDVVGGMGIIPYAR